jgi:hypothetical protein
MPWRQRHRDLCGHRGTGLSYASSLLKKNIQEPLTLCFDIVGFTSIYMCWSLNSNPIHPMMQIQLHPNKTLGGRHLEFDGNLDCVCSLACGKE